MIPLAHWLDGRGTRGGAGLPPAPADSGPPQHKAGENVSPALVEEAYQRGRIDGRAEMETAIQNLIGEHGKTLQEMEAAVNARWAARSAQDVEGSIATAFRNLRLQLDQALCGVLLPFLDKAVTENASARLIELVRQEAMRASEPILDIKAPADLHGTLSELLPAQGILATLTSSDVVEVTARDGTSRFASMASRWLGEIRSHEP